MNLYLRRFCTLSDADYSIENADVAFLGVPFDSTVIDRPGARYGPTAIRTAFERFEGYNVERGVDIYKRHRLSDLGDIDAVPGSFELTEERIVDTVQKVFEKNEKVLPIFLGGEHGITLPIVKAFPKDIAIVSLDAHLDLRDSYLGNKLTHVTYLRRIAEFIDPKNIIVAGVRSSSEEEEKFAKGAGISYYRTSEIAKDADKIAKEIGAKTQGKKVYLTIDIDVLDPGLAPGTASPVPNGLQYPALLKLLEPLADKIAGMDVTEVSPLYDRTEMTAYHAARAIYDILTLRKTL